VSPKPFSLFAPLTTLAVLATGCGGKEPLPPPPSEVCTGTTALDVLPGTYPNAVDLAGTGALEVAVLGDGTLDARTLDPTTATLSDPDGSAPSVSAEPALREQDVNGDGHVDAVLSFPLASLRDNGVLHAKVSRLKLDTKTHAGAQVGGCDRAQASDHLLTRLPVPTGPHAVGTTAFSWVDTGRDETFTDAKKDKRELMMRVWYPASSTPQAQPAPYFLVRREGIAQLKQGGVNLPPGVLDFVHTHSVAEAPLAAGERFPVILFSPGAGFSPTFYSSVLEELASHGYVVVATSHTYTNGPVIFPDGRYAPHTEEPSGLFGTPYFDVVVTDLRFVLSQVRALDVGGPEGRFTGRLDLERVGVFGHSIGGAASAIVCQKEPGVRACANLDGSFQGSWSQGIPQPLLLVHAQAHDDGTHRSFIHDRRAPVYELSVSQAGHLTFSDLPLLLALMKVYDPKVSSETFDTGALEPAERAASLTRAWVLAFAQEHVKGSGESPLLHGGEGSDPAVTFTAHPR
jgi:dienelactone hydrolase/predicted small lipoprotein YifL